MVVDPGAFDADGSKHLNDTEDFFNTGDIAKSGRALVKQSGTEKRDGGIFTGINSNFTTELVATLNAIALDFCIINRDDLPIESLGDLFYLSDSEVLGTLL